jgi:hypothetical protein
VIGGVLPVSATSPALAYRLRRVIHKVLAGPVVEVVGALDNEIVIILVKCDREFVRKPISAENTLERHLEGWIHHKRDPSCPVDSWFDREREFDVLKLDRPLTSENPDPSMVCSGLPEPNADGSTGALIEERDRGSGVDERAKAPVSGMPVLKPDIQGWPQDGWITLLAIREEVTDPGQSAHANHDVVSPIRHSSDPKTESVVTQLVTHDLDADESSE